MRGTVIALMLVAAAPAGAAEHELTTVVGAVLCVSPYDIKEASLAAGRGDDDWMKSIGCVLAKPDIPAVFIEGNRPNSTWQVRLMIPGGRGLTLYGWPCSFRPTAGKEKFDCGKVYGPAY